jgi:hypothetical protein
VKKKDHAKFTKKNFSHTKNKMGILPQQKNQTLLCQADGRITLVKDKREKGDHVYVCFVGVDWVCFGFDFAGFFVKGRSFILQEQI